MVSILFLLTAIGVCNGTIVGIYLLCKQKRQLHEIYFGALLIALSIRIGKSVYYYFNDATDFLILQIGLSACIFIGPLFLFYIKALIQHAKRPAKIDLVTLLILLVGIICVGSFYPYRQYPDIWNGTIIYWIYAIWAVFTIAALGLSYCFLTRPGQTTRFSKTNLRYFIAILCAIVFITLTYQVALFFGFTYMWGAMIFTFSFYYLFARYLNRTKSVLPKVNAPLNQEIQDQIDAIDQIMMDQKPYRNHGFQLADLVALTGLNKNELSGILNQKYVGGFSFYLNQFRVNEAKQLIAFRDDLTLEGIGNEAGFSSRSSFFSTFKKIANCTPAQYKTQIASSQPVQKSPK